MRYSSSAHTRFYHRYHVVWATKDRHKVFEGAMRARLREIIRQSCDEMGVHIARGVLARDHVHMFLSIPPKLSLSVVVQRIKGRSSRRIPTDVPDDLLTVAPLRSGFLSHLHSLVVAMSQKSSLIKSP